MSKEDDKLVITLRGEARVGINSLAKTVGTTPNQILEEALELYEGIVRYAGKGELPYLREGTSDGFARLQMSNSCLEVYLQKCYDALMKKTN